MLGKPKPIANMKPWLWDNVPARYRLNLVADILTMNEAYAIEAKALVRILILIARPSFRNYLRTRIRYGNLIARLVKKGQIDPDKIYDQAQRICKLESINEVRLAITDYYRMRLWKEKLARLGLSIEDAQAKAVLLGIEFLQQRYPAVEQYLEETRRGEYVSWAAHVDRLDGRYIVFITVSMPTGYEFFHIRVDLEKETAEEILSGESFA